MKRLFIAVALAVLVAGPVAASDDKDILVTLHQFVDGFNKGDMKSIVAACADQMSIIDEIPPHEWHGPAACATWLADYDADARKNGITDGLVTFGKPRHLDIHGDRAYVVVPANYTFHQLGKAVKESGSTLTFTLQNGEYGWRITGWAWAKK